MGQLAGVPDCVVEGHELRLCQQLWQPLGLRRWTKVQQLPRMLEDLLEIGIIGMLSAEDTPQLFGHRFGRESCCHQAASRKEGWSRSKVNSP